MTDDRSSEFGVTDHSLSAPILKKGISDRVINILPAWYSPNALTLTGGVVAGSSILLVWSLFPEMRAGSTIGRVAMMTSALLLIIYAVFDQLDGMQARRLGKSSPFGDFLDHWVDTIIANNITVPIMVMLQLERPLVWLMAFITSLAFWAHNWETRNTNYRHLPAVGGLESVWTALVIMTLTTIFGLSVWQLSWFGISLLSVFYWYGFAALAWVVIKALRNSHIRLGDYLGFIATLLPVCAWHLWFAAHYAGDEPVVWAGFIVMGFMATQSTGYLMKHLWLAGEYRAFDAVSFGLGLVMCAASAANTGVSIPSVLEIWLVPGIAVLCVGRVIFQGWSSYRQMLPR